MTNTHEAIYAAADTAGKAAAEATNPTPMVVQQRANGFDDTSEVVQEWVVPSGVCGFGWVNIRPGTSSFARWIKKQGIGDKAYEGGINIWVGAYGQSYEKKIAYAHAFAAVLRDAGIKAWGAGRLD
jgi:hypothetical protein